MKVATYTRISTDEERQPFSLEAQGDRLSAYIASQSTAAGRMMVQILGVFAEFERATLVERTVMGLSKKAAKGEWTGGTPPFGYRYDSDQGLLVPVPDLRLAERRGDRRRELPGANRPHA
jgi:DNA invertase Pin-like site-specific DNA recombinase